jgi:hypothetical protein
MVFAPGLDRGISSGYTAEFSRPNQPRLALPRPVVEGIFMRPLLFLIALLAGGYAGYLGTLGKTSYALYSKSQLDQLEQEHSRLLRHSRGDTTEHALALQLIRQERERPPRLHGSAGAAALAFVIALLLPRPGRALAGEEHRFVDHVGDPVLTGQGARHKAAALLGVLPDAPPAVIEAALQAQLAARDPARLEGIAPDLRHTVLEQREELLRAGNLLLGRQEVPPSKASRGA